MKKRLTSLMITLALVFAAVPAFAGYDDVSADAWYADAVRFMTDSGYMNGVSETEFAPDAGMTRGMFVTVLGRMDGAYTDNYTKKIFPDVDMDLWYAPYVNWAFENNIVSGFEDLSFHPNESVNRAQLSVMINRYIQYRGITLPDNPNAYESFSDADAIPAWAADGAELMRRTGIITGDAYGGFMPMSLATRAQISAIVMRLRSVMNGEVLEIPRRAERTPAETVLSGMSLRDKVYQLMAVTPEQLTGVQTATMAGTTTKESIEKTPVGALVYSEKNILDSAQIQSMLSNTGSYSKIKPFMMISEETGSGAGAAAKLGRDTFKTAYDYRTSDPSVVKTAYSALGSSLKESGFNVNLAPVGDLWTNPSNSFIAKRAFGNKYEECAPRTKAAIEGTKEAQLLSAMKYFPGYGSCAANPENGVCASDRTLEELRNYDFNVYKDGIDAGADFVVCANVMMKDIDPYYPASLSTIFINDLLRNELGFAGVVISDDFRMKAISQNYTSAAAAVRAVEAGCDMIMCPDDYNEAAEAVINAVENGALTENQINNSVMRILNKKAEAGMLN